MMNRLRELLNIAAPPREHRLGIPAFVAGAGAASTWFTLFHTRLEPLGNVDTALSELVLDAVIILTCLACALVARRGATLARRPAAVGLACTLACAGTLLATFCAQSPAAFLAGGVLGMVGTSLLLLLWKEYFACLSPTRIALYVACSMIAGEALRFILLGFTPAYFGVAMALLPVLSCALLVRAFRSLPAEELPGGRAATSPRVPVWLIGMVAAYALCYGLVAKNSASSVIITSFSKLLPAALVILAILLQSERFSFNDVYRLGLPLAVCGGALFCGFSGMDATVANLFITFGFITCCILATVGLGSAAHAAGGGATCLFGIQVAAQYAASLMGKVAGLPAVQAVLPTGFLGAATLAACLATAGLVALFMRDERRFDLVWGASGDAPASDAQADSLARIQRAAQAAGLSGREVEVLRLLLEGKTLAQVGRELCIAQGTVKSHANRIYRKLGVTGRGELEAALQQQARPADS